MKITPKDYIEAQASLGRAGFMAIQTLLAESKAISDVATTFGIPENVVELVKTTSSYDQYLTIAELERERAELKVEVETVKTEKATIQPQKWHFWVAGVILLAILTGIVWGIVWLIGLL